MPVLGFASNLTEALNFNVNINSTLYPVDGVNIMEGGVLEPSKGVYSSPDGSVFSIKKKNAAFKDKQKERKVVRDPSDGFSDEVVEYRETFLSYVNDNTVQSVFSKHGPIDSYRDIGKYITLVIQDARETYLKENEFTEEGLTKNDLRYILNCGNMVVEILKTYL
jgi:hypothetical protein